MITGTPSRTAYGAAMRRAAHQFLENGRIFNDPLALRIVGAEKDEILKEMESDPPQRRLGMRLSLAARSRFAENRLADAVDKRGTRQFVVLGAGLDTFAYRSPYGSKLRVFEVDHPDTQVWKRAKLAEAGIEIPDWLVFVPLDFERDMLPDALVAAGFDPSLRSFFSWLGVVLYLTRDAVLGTLGIVAGFSGGSDIVFDFSEPPETLQPERRAAFEARKAQVAGFGEPWLSTFQAEDLHAHLRRLGFAEIIDLGPRQIARRFFPALAAGAPVRGGHFVHAAMP